MSDTQSRPQKKRKQSVRDLKRLLQNRGDTLPAEVKAEKEQELKTAITNARQRKQEFRRVKLEKKNASRYKMVKFFDRKKTSRRLQQTERKLQELTSQVPPEGDEAEALKIQEEKEQLEKLVKQLQEDLLYIRNYPNKYKYVSLIGTDPRTVERRERIRAEVFAKLAQQASSDNSNTFADSHGNTSTKRLNTKQGAQEQNKEKEPNHKPQLEKTLSKEKSVASVLKEIDEDEDESSEEIEDEEGGSSDGEDNTESFFIPKKLETTQAKSKGKAVPSKPKTKEKNSDEDDGGTEKEEKDDFFM